MLIGLSISAAAEGRAFGALGLSLNSKLMLNIRGVALGSSIRKYSISFVGNKSLTRGRSRLSVPEGMPTQSVSQFRN